MLTLLFTTAALLLISLTMLLRCHEFNDKGPKAMLRKFGLLLSGVAPVGLVLALWFGWNLDRYLCFFSVGIFTVFFTTPNGVPWTKWVWHGLQELEHELEGKPAKEEIG